LRSVFDAPTLEHAKARLTEVVAEWRPRYPDLADKLEAETEDTLACFQFPAGHRVRIRTTNMMERLNQELRRRSRVVSIFPQCCGLSPTDDGAGAGAGGGMGRSGYVSGHGRTRTLG